jgi:hypothetical protein
VTNLLIQQVVRLVNETDCDVSDNFGGAGFTELAEILVGGVRVTTEPPYEEGLAAVLVLDPELSSPKKVTIVAQ